MVVIGIVFFKKNNQILGLPRAVTAHARPGRGRAARREGATRRHEKVRERGGVKERDRVVVRWKREGVAAGEQGEETWYFRVSYGFT